MIVFAPTYLGALYQVPPRGVRQRPDYARPCTPGEFSSMAPLLTGRPPLPLFRPELAAGQSGDLPRIAGFKR